MKSFLLKFSKFLLNFIIIVGAVVSVGNFVLQLLPADISQPVLDWLNTNLETLLPYGISSAVTTIVLALAKYFNTFLQVMLKDSENKQALQRKQLEESYNERIAIAEERDYAIVGVLNDAIELLKDISKQNKYIINYDKIVALKNIASTIIPDKYKNMFREWTARANEDSLTEVSQIEIVEALAEDKQSNKDGTEERELI